MKVFIDPPNSLVLFDLVERFGHEPLSAMAAIQERVDNLEVDMPPMNVTLDDVVKGLKYAGVEVPSGIRGRLALWGPMIDEADAAIIMDDCPYSFGCVGCERSNLMVKYLIKRRGIPALHVSYPEDDEQAVNFVAQTKEFLEGDQRVPGGTAVTIKIAQLSCGTEYSSVQYEIEKAARSVGAKIVYPDVSAADIDEAVKRFGFNPRSPQLKLMIARAVQLADEKYDADAVFITTCFRCAEAALVRNELRRFIQEHTRLPVVTYSFTERLKASQLLTRMEALVTIVTRKELLARERQTGLTAGLDSGSSTTKAVIMQDNKIIGKDWTPSGDVVKSATQVLENAMKMAGVELKDIEAIGTTGYGRFTLGDHFNAKLVQEELTVNSKGAVWLADRQRGEATIIDIGGMDNKAITVRDGVPDNFTMGGICAGASGRFLEMTSRRMKIDVTELGALADKGDWRNAKMNSYCSVFGIQDLVTTLGEGKSFEDVAAAACHSVAEQVYEQQLQEIDVRHPIIQVGGTSLISGLVTQVGEVLGEKPIVPPDSQYIGAVGGALLSSGFL